MRWIDLHPSDTTSQTSTVAERVSATDADVLSAARAAHHTALEAAEQAHRAAASAWSGPTQKSVATSLYAHHASLHLERAEALAEAASASAVPPADGLVADPPETPAAQWAQALGDAAQLPSPEAGVSRPRLGLRVGLVAGPRLRLGFFGLAELRDLTAEDWQTQLEHLDLLMIGSETEESPEFLLETLIPAARARGLPVVLVVTSGPALGSSLSIAERCTQIFATDPEAAAVLRSRCPEHVEVEVIPHPVSPLLHTPVGTRPARTPLIALLGMEQRHPAPHLEEPQFIPPLVDGVLGAGRTAALLPPEPRPHHWSIPADYAPWTLTRAEAALVGSARETAQVQRAMDVGLAVNAVMDSQAVFDPQILQLQASGTMVLATYNQGVNSYYPQVHIANSAEDVAKTLETMTLDELRRVQADGIRTIFTAHHGTDVLTRIARAAGLEIPAHQDRVLVVADELTEDLRADIASQTHPAVEITTWAELAASRTDDAEDLPDTSRFEILVPMSCARRYSPEYLADHVAAFRYQAAAVTTKLDGDADSTDDAAHQRRAGVADLGLSAWWRPAPEALDSPDALLETLEAGAGATDSTMPVYALDHLGHRPAGARREIDREQGTDMAQAREEFRRTAEELGLELAVVVPIYNNGDHLRHKAFASLRRSGIFEKMHILLINDGSTDASTVDTIEELAHVWPNVSAFHHARGGSGSASRPRNTGLALSFTEFVTYLDPDDEELEDGYWELLERLREAPEADYALGTMAVWTRKYGVHDYHQWFQAGVEHRDGLHWPTADSLVTLNFRPASIEAMVARTAWLQRLGLVQPVGAVGQDSYFFQQLFFHTRAYVPVYRPVYTYYGAVETSIVNVISPNYFRKYLILEQDRAAWLREVGLFEVYLEQRFESFFVSWYLQKYKRVLPHDRDEAAGVLRELIAAYGDVRWRDPRGLEFFRSPEGRP
ncbi:glycosyltransferase family 2 protein [Nesterenkonia sp. YGD6]|uniref:glycosyltransferase family 2 protein n=1 Tax=Nesterenkonia sp. YGD6 TaxID=2901231 RepID=UPI001F4C99F7|nr:glycosyltransferase family 2 protein [Nesterenkonia sp. YGD6]